MFRVGILTVSDKGHAGERQDTAGPELGRLLDPSCFKVAAYEIVPDEPQAIAAQLTAWSDTEGLDLILTTGGTGFSPRDVTPEATQAVIEREAPGLVFAMLQSSLAVTPHAMLSRAAAGMRGQTLIVNLPGSPKAARENLESILPALPHALELLRAAPAAEAGHTFSG